MFLSKTNSVVLAALFNFLLSIKQYTKVPNDVYPELVCARQDSYLAFWFLHMFQAMSVWIQNVR